MEGRADEVVRLNVGGVVYCTSRATLCKEESFLSAMMSGRHTILMDAVTQAYFIDRDGQTFRHILNYLRRGRLIVPDDPTLAAELLSEARFFGLASLVELLLPKREAFQYVSDMDTNGVLYWLGTQGKSQPWTNPVLSGLVRVRSSKPVTGAPHSVADRKAQAGGICTDSRNQWVEVDIGKDNLLHPTHYTLSDGGCCLPSNWAFQGSEDRKEWVTLSNHVKDTCLTTRGSHTWVLEPPPHRQFFRWFRLLGLGHDQASATCYCMHFSCLELYGDLRVNKRVGRRDKGRSSGKLKDSLSEETDL